MQLDFDALKNISLDHWHQQLSSVTVDLGPGGLPGVNRTVNGEKEVNGANETADKDDVLKFYSALYRASLSPSVFSETTTSNSDDRGTDTGADANADADTEAKQYLGMDGRRHTLEDGIENYYTDMSLWDIHRTQLPWLILTDQVRLC